MTPERWVLGCRLMKRLAVALSVLVPLLFGVMKDARSGSMDIAATLSIAFKSAPVLLPIVWITFAIARYVFATIDPRPEPEQAKTRKSIRRGIIWSAAAIVGLAAIWGVVNGVCWWNENRPRVQNSFWEIPLGATKADVRLLKGQPSNEPDPDVWVYSSRWGNYSINYIEEKVTVVSFQGDYESLQGIQSKISTTDDVRRKFGQPTTVSTGKNGLSMCFWYAQYHVCFYFAKNSVDSLGIYEPSRFAPPDEM